MPQANPRYPHYWFPTLNYRPGKQGPRPAAAPPGERERTGKPRRGAPWS